MAAHAREVMDTRVAVTVAALLCVTVWARPSDAQATRSDHVRVSIDVGAQPSASTFSATTNIPVYQQTSTLTTIYRVPSGQSFDGGVILRMSGGFGVGVGVSSFAERQAATISGSIPHPLFLRPRPISGTTSPLERSEIIGYINAAYVHSGTRMDLGMSGGPAFFTVNQDLVANVTYDEAPPFDTVAFTGALVTKATATSIGFNASVDVGIKLWKNIGVGAAVRYSRASVTFPLANTASGVHADAGGLHAGGGLRLYF
jgi:hypothetical protein